ncbi:MAG TPA: cytochrome c oxidase subunit 3, partial [Myxococcota bacterium]|nr:cytochrome c oxidase subunit 3 [Myxococcota bacterium]
LTTCSSLYGATFYAIVGAHATHVLIALGVLGFALREVRRGQLTGWAELAPYRMYWLFVVGIWPILYALVYWR